MNDKKRTNSRSDVQMGIEKVALDAFAKKRKILLEEQKKPLDDLDLTLDGYFKDESSCVLAEAWAHVGRAKGSQPQKVISDVMKLAFVKKKLESANPNCLIDACIIFVDKEAAQVLSGDSWRAHAAREFGITYEVVKISDAERAALKQAQQRQDIRDTKS